MTSDQISEARQTFFGCVYRNAESSPCEIGRYFSHQVHDQRELITAVVNLMNSAFTVALAESQDLRMQMAALEAEKYALEDQVKGLQELMATPQPPALGGEPESKLIKLAAELASRRPIRSLQDLCDRQKSVSTAKLIEDVEMCGDFLAAIAVDIRHCVEASRAHLAPLQAEITHQNNLRIEAQDFADQLKARNAELEKDREALEYLMGQFEVEVCVCDRCGDEKEMKDSDSAYYLRDHLKNTVTDGQAGDE